MGLPSKGTIQEQKELLRHYLKSILRMTETCSDSLVEQLITFLKENETLKTVAIYHALKGEPDLMRLLSLESIRFVFPRVERDRLVFCEAKAGIGSLRRGAFGIMEPMPEAEVINLDDIDVFCCPGLGFDRQGGRLGKGRGFYDECLARAAGASIKIGICFENQVVLKVPMAEHDIAMDLLVTESGLAAVCA